MEYNGLIIFGEMGSGKDTLADLMMEAEPRVKKYGLGDAMRYMSRIATVDPQWFDNQRTFMQQMADKMREIDPDVFNQFALATMLMENLPDYDLRGQDYDAILKDHFKQIHQRGVLPIIVGGRTWMDYDFWKDRRFLTVGIDIDRQVRLDRLRQRDGDAVALKSDGAHNTERDVYDIIQKCQVKADNNGDLENLRQEAQRILELL